MEEEEDPYAHILETCTPTCSHGVRRFSNTPSTRTPEVASGEPFQLYGRIGEDSLGDYLYYSPPPPPEQNPAYCATSYQDSPPPSVSIFDDFQDLRVQEIDDYEEVSIDGDHHTYPKVGDVSHLSWLKAFAKLDFWDEKEVYGEVLSFFTVFRISKFVGVPKIPFLCSISDEPKPQDSPRVSHLESSEMNPDTQLVDSHCGFQGLCHSPKSKRKGVTTTFESTSKKQKHFGKTYGAVCSGPICNSEMVSLIGNDIKKQSELENSKSDNGDDDDVMTMPFFDLITHAGNVLAECSGSSYCEAIDDFS